MCCAVRARISHAWQETDNREENERVGGRAADNMYVCNVAPIAIGHCRFGYRAVNCSMILE